MEGKPENEKGSGAWIPENGQAFREPRTEKKNQD
jgi:hypothetical protein